MTPHELRKLSRDWFSRADAIVGAALFEAADDKETIQGLRSDVSALREQLQSAEAEIRDLYRSRE